MPKFDSFLNVCNPVYIFPVQLHFLKLHFSQLGCVFTQLYDIKYSFLMLIVYANYPWYNDRPDWQTTTSVFDCLIWFGWVLWYINPCGILNARPGLYICIYYMTFLWVTFLNEPELFCLYTVKWLQVLRCNTNNSGFPPICEIDVFKDYSSSIGQCWTKKILRNNFIKNVNINEQWTRFPNL